MMQSEILRPLPPIYQEVEWIKSDGNQYIEIPTLYESGIPVLETYDFTINFDISKPDGLFITARYQIASDYNVFGLSSTILNKHYLGMLTYSGNNLGGIEFPPAKVDYMVHLNWCQYDRKSSTFIINGTPYGILNKQFTYQISDVLPYSDKYRLFRVYDGKLKGRITRKFNNKLVQLLAPCYTKDNNIKGLYDLMNGKFYTNDGTGDFTVGPDVN